MENSQQPGSLKNLFQSSLRITGISRIKRNKLQGAASSPPGIDHLPDVQVPPLQGTLRMQCIYFGGQQCESLETEDIHCLINQELPDWAANRWINIEGLHPYVVSQLAQHYKLHPLAAEDVLNPHQRPKLEIYEDGLFVVMRMLRLVDNHLINEQVSFWLCGTTLITLQEQPGDVWEGVRKRLQKSASRFRKFGTSYLLYALIDAIIDHFFPLLEAYGTTIDQLETEILSQQDTRQVQQRIHAIKRELIFLRQVMWPIRDVASALYRDEFELFEDSVETYYRDVYDHAVQVIDTIEVYREMAGGLHELYNSKVANRMNQVMKTLTIIASIFVPTTFLAGVYGMNFEYVPELDWKYAYPTFWGTCLLLTASLLYFFYRKGWLGDSE